MSDIKLFKEKKVRTHFDSKNEKWYFSVIDVIEILTGSPRPRKYWNALKTKLNTEGSELSQNMGQLTKLFIQRELLHHILFLLAFSFLACKNPSIENNADTNAIDTKTKGEETKTNVETIDMLISYMNDKVILDTFLKKITNQKNVRILSKLNENWNDTAKIYTYSSGDYYFELKVKDKSTTFKDRGTEIRFNDCSLLCQPDSIFKCEDYGFKYENTLIEPKIIEVSGKKFLYSDVSYECNGIGCGCSLTFIYDLQNKKATFLENYRIPFDGFFLSDFDNDNNPDLLVISQSKERKMKGFDFEEFDVKLSWYNYDKGNFKQMFDKQLLRPYTYELYSFTPDYHHSYHNGLTYSITKDNWLRQSESFTTDNLH